MISIIRVTTQIIRAINKHKDEFPILFSEYKREKKRWHKRFEEYAGTDSWKPKITNHILHVSEESIQEYLSLVNKYLAVKKLPNSNRKVVITTHNGGKHVGFYEDDKWWYTTAEGNKVQEKGIIIKWEKNYF